MTDRSAFMEILPGSARRVASRARRADRLPPLLGLRLDAGIALDALRVMVIGAGAVGAVAARSLAHLQPGGLWIVDRARFKPASLLTQLITPHDVGQPKATTVARLCKDISPRTRVFAFDGPFQELGLADLAGVTVLIVAGDNLTLLHDVARHASALGLKMIHAAVHGETLTAQCRTFSHATAAHPCSVCLFDAEEFRMMQQERTLSCDGFRNPSGGVRGRALHQTASLHPLCLLAGAMAALQAVKLALHLKPSPQDTLFELCAHTWRSIVTPIHRNLKCPCPHERLAIRAAPRELSTCSITELRRAAGIPRCAHAPVLVTVEGFRWIERGLCGCGLLRPVHRLIRHEARTAGRCRRCRQSIHPQPFFTHEVIPASLTARLQDRALHALGATTCRGVVVRHGNRGVLLTNPKPASPA